MNYKFLIFLTATVILIVAAFYMNVGNDGKDIQLNSNVDLRVENKVVAKKINTPEAPVFPAPVRKSTPYEGEWCSRSELNGDDLQFAIVQSDEWGIASGNLRFASDVSDKGLFPLKGAQLIEPYRDMGLAALFELVEEDHEISMISALHRYDITDFDRTEIANRLLVLGKTGIALEHLVRREVVKAMAEFKRTKDNSEKIRKRMITAMTYANFGIERYDSAGLNALLVSLEGVQKESRLGLILTEDLESEVSAKLVALKDDIDRRRLAENFVPIAELEIPKIAKHNFKFDMALNYATYGNIFSLLVDVNPSYSSYLEKDDCVVQELVLLNR